MTVVSAYPGVHLAFQNSNALGYCRYEYHYTPLQTLPGWVWKTVGRCSLSTFSFLTKHV